MQRVLLATTRNGNSASEGCELFKASIIQAISLTASVISCDSSELRKVAPLSTADGSLSTERRPPDAREILVTLSASATNAILVQSCLRHLVLLHFPLLVLQMPCLCNPVYDFCCCSLSATNSSCFTSQSLRPPDLGFETLATYINCIASCT